MLSLDRVAASIAPHDCLLCGVEGALLCAGCMVEAVTPLPSRCYRCQVQTQDSATCERCRRLTPLKHVWMCTEYDSLAKNLIHRLKFERAQAAAGPIAELLSDALPFLPADTLVTHVPTATTRRRQRGYDQAELIARAFAKRRNLQADVLLARSGQSRQVGADRSHRLSQLAEAYRPIKAALSAPTVLLIDDVMTTGATLESAARVLRAAGIKKIYGATFAHKR